MLGIFNKKNKRSEELTEEVMIIERDDEVVINHTDSSQAEFRDVKSVGYRLSQRSA